MATPSPPKPWERGGSSTGRTSAALSTLIPSTTTTAPTSSSSSSTPPAIPERPSALSSVVNRTASNYTNSNLSLANRGYGASPYGGYGSSAYTSSYSSPYSRFGGYGSSMYGGGMYGGGMGGMYGSGMYGGMGGMYGGGMGGMPGDPNDPNSMTNNFQQSTQATFQIIESIVGAFGGFAQMLESTYMATHSSFFAMVSVAEQFGNLRQTLGSVLGIFTLLRWMKTLLAKITGRPPPADATSLTPSAFAAFTGSAMPDTVGPNGQPKPPRPSKKPFIVFLLAVFGLPYLMGKLIKALAKSQEAAMQNQPPQIGPNGQLVGPDGRLQPRSLDPSKLDFCRVLYDFPPPEAVANGTFDGGLDLEVKKGDLVAVLDKSDPSNNGNSAAEGQWWRCRARDGRMGYLPAVYLETIQRKPQQAQITETAGSNPGSRAQTMSGAIGSRSNTLAGSASSGSRAQTLSSSTQMATAPGTRTATMKSKDAGKPVTSEKDDPQKLESFQKAWANDR